MLRSSEKWRVLAFAAGCVVVRGGKAYRLGSETAPGRGDSRRTAQIGGRLPLVQ